MKKNELEALLEKGLSFHSVAKLTNKSFTTIRYWAKKYGLTSSHKNILSQAIVPHLCTTCGQANNAEFYGNHKSKCKKCFSKERCDEYIEKKMQAITYLGGACINCGYSRYYGALEFHHLNPEEKDVDWSKLRRRAWDRIKHELDKCALLCSICHREAHAGMVDLGAPGGSRTH